MKFEIFKHGTVTSTNDVSKKLIKDSNKESGCNFADLQTNGRGTKGKKWISQKGNLFGTFFFHLKNSYPPFNEFAFINLVIILSVIEKFCEKKYISLKWPNDIFVNKKKICGILQELITQDEKIFLIIGIGINIVSNPEINEEYKTTNIFEETKKKPKIDEIIKTIILSYEKFFLNLGTYNYSNFKKKAESFLHN